MPAEDMGKISGWLRMAFAVTSVLFVIALAISPVKDLLREWKHYKRSYVRFAKTRPDTKRLLADSRPEIDQIWIPELGVVDRCTTCHQGISQPSLLDPSVPQPFRAHPPIPHRVREWGCTVCHRGQGPATEVAEAHETTLGWEQPLLPTHFIQGSCGTCHRGDLPETPQLNHGRQLLADFNCVGCHRLQDIERPAMLGPDLTSIGTKVSREWIYKWLKEPRTITDKDGNVTVGGYETEEEPRMPQFRLNEPELRMLSAFLSKQQRRPVEAYHFDQRVVTAWSKKPDLVEQGEVRFRQMFCSTCHSLAVTRAGETKLIGGDIGPELTKVGSKVNPDWLVVWLRDPQAYLPHSRMPRYEWSDEDLYKVTQYITSKLTDPDLLANVPQLGPPAADEVQRGRQLFLEKGCASCHLIEGIGAQKDLGPDLSALGGKNVSQLEFGQAKIPRNLISYIQAKITDPASVNPAARMPQYHLTPEDLDALTTALLSMAGPPSTSGTQKLIVARAGATFHPAGEFGRVYERYKCYACHQFNGYGGTLAPALSYEGSRAQRQWLISFLKNPQTLRPTLVLRMPQFNMTDQEATTLADYLGMALQSPGIDLASVDAKKFTPQMAALGKQLYEVKYQCQSCHTIGSAGGYVGPNLNNAGNWLTPAWIEAWLRNPQTLVPGTVEPRRAFTEDEIQSLTAYLVTLRQSASPQKTARATPAVNPIKEAVAAGRTGAGQ
jgi:mono/diheme cytochrome c family protein